MRISVLKSNRRIIEMQAAALPGTLLKNAINAGYAADAVEELEVDAAGYTAAKAEDPVEIVTEQIHQATLTAEAAKIRAVLDNLPDWQTVSTAIDAANTIPKLQVIVKKLARVLYWIAKNKEA
jgi:hypothetical protein